MTQTATRKTKVKPDFFRAVLSLDCLGMITGTQDVAKHVWVAGETIGWGNVAYELASRLPGTVRPNPSGGISWYNGSNGPHGVIVCWNRYKDLLGARELYQSIVPESQRKREPWSVGSVAARLLAYVGEPYPYSKGVERFLLRHPYGYHECDPGVYDNDSESFHVETQRHLFHEPTGFPNLEYKPAVTLYDVQSYYYNLIRRLPSLRVGIDDADKVDFFPMRESERLRWKDILDAVETSKPVRNSIAGAMCGTLKPRLAFTSSRPDARKDPKGHAEWYPGKVRQVYFPGSEGPYRSAGLLVVATGAELCYKEALTHNAIYATIDSVALRGEVPTVWKSYGFTVEVKASGNADICHRGSYRIGQKRTLNYANGDRDYYGTARREVPFLYTKQWL